MKLSYGKPDFVKAGGRKTDNGEGDTRRRRGGGRVENYNPAKSGVRGKRRQGDSPENSRRLFIMLRGATRIPAQRLGKICGYSNSENSEGEMDRNKT